MPPLLIFKFGSREWLGVATFVIASGSLAYAAWNGETWAIFLLAAFNVSLAILSQASQKTTSSVLSMYDDVTDWWEKDRDYAMSLTQEHAAVLRELAEYDPAQASIYYARLRQQVLKRRADYVPEAPPANPN